MFSLNFNWTQNSCVHFLLCACTLLFPEVLTYNLSTNSNLVENVQNSYENTTINIISNIIPTALKMENNYIPIHMF